MLAGGMPVVLGDCSREAREVLPGMMPGIFGGCLRSARRQARGLLPGLLAGCSPRYSRDAGGMFFVLLPGKSAGARGSLVVCSPRDLEDAPGMLGDVARDARGRCPGCSGTLSGMLGVPWGCSPALSGVSGGCRGLPGPSPPVRLRAPRRGWRSGGAGGRRRGGEGVVSPARLSRRPGSINEIIMQIEQPCATRQPYLILAGGEGGQGGPRAPPPGAAGTGLAVPVRLAFPRSGDPAATPRQPDTQEGHGRARPTAVPGASRRCCTPDPARAPGGTVPSRSRSARGGTREQDRGGQETEPGRLRVRGWARGWQGVARGGTRREPCVQTHTRRSGNIKLHCR